MRGEKLVDYERELIPLARLRLNKENDRHGPLPSEVECLDWLLTHHRDHMLNLAKDIAEHGLSPLDSILVLPASTETPGEYVVWEGNRRVAALKLLDDPNRCHDQGLYRRFAKTKNEAQAALPTEVECVVAPSNEEADRLIELRHQGPQDGIGTVPWDARQKERHQERLGKRGRYAFSHDVLDAIADRLEADLRERVQGMEFPISTLDRILKDTRARKFLGLSTEGGAPQRVFEEKETLKGLVKILLDLAEGRLPVRKVYTSDKIREYLDGFPKKNTPDPRTVLQEPVPLTAHEGKLHDASVAKARPRPVAHERKRLIPAGVSYRIEDARLNVIYHELRRLDVETYRNAVSVLFRVFLELSVDFYLDSQAVKYFAHDKLASKIQKAVIHMKEKGWLDKKASKGIDSAVSSKNDLHSVDTFHAYVHNRRFQPLPSDLNTAWDNLQPFLDVLFSHQE